jgi:hypothetical protein
MTQPKPIPLWPINESLTVVNHKSLLLHDNCRPRRRLKADIVRAVDLFGGSMAGKRSAEIPGLVPEMSARGQKRERIGRSQPDDVVLKGPFLVCGPLPGATIVPGKRSTSASAESLTRGKLGHAGQLGLKSVLRAGKDSRLCGYDSDRSPARSRI